MFRAEGAGAGLFHEHTVALERIVSVAAYTVSKSDGTRKVEHAYHFRKRIDAVYQKIIKISPCWICWSKLQLVKVGAFFETQCRGLDLCQHSCQVLQTGWGGQAGRSGTLPIPPPLSAAELSVEENWMCITSGCVLRGKSVAYLDISVADGQSRF